MSQLCLYLQQLSFSRGCHFHLCLAIIKVIVQHKGQRFDVPPHVQVSLTIIMKSQLPKQPWCPTHACCRLTKICTANQSSGMKTTAFYAYQCQPFRSVFKFWKQNRGIATTESDGVSAARLLLLPSVTIWSFVNQKQLLCVVVFRTSRIRPQAAFYAHARAKSDTEKQCDPPPPEIISSKSGLTPAGERSLPTSPFWQSYDQSSRKTKLRKRDLILSLPDLPLFLPPSETKCALPSAGPIEKYIFF